MEDRRFRARRLGAGAARRQKDARQNHRDHDDHWQWATNRNMK
jgi:hypothetical protein